MSDKSRNGRVSPPPVQHGRERSLGRQKLKSAGSRSNVSDDQPEAPPNDSSFSKPEPESLPTALQKQRKEDLASAKTSFVKVDVSTNTVTFDGNLRIFGTDNEDSTKALIYQVLCIVPDAAGKHGLENLKYALATIKGISPQDELEGLLAVQMMGVHSLAVECLRRASLENQTTEGMDTNINRAAKLMRTFTSQMEALNRHRGIVGQQMVVGNVNVNDGGKAIVGPVSRLAQAKVPRKDDPQKIK